MNTPSSDKKPFNPLEGCAWPDPDPTNGEELHVNDVSQLSETRVDRILFPRSEEDVVDILQQALSQHKRVSIRGTQHSMGGHCMTRGGIVVDTRYLNRMHYSEQENTITVGTGCTWADVILHLNEYGKSPQVMQSYCTFSIGGTLSVNAHGITSDESLASCVTSFRLVHYHGEKVQVTTCTCPTSNDSEAILSKEEELFGLVIGGYGMFGIVTQVTLKVANNADLEMDSLTSLSLHPDITNDGQECEFVRVWDACRADTDHVDIKLARLDTVTLDTASLFLFRKFDATKSTISNLSMQPRQLSSWARLLYKWALPLLKEFRQAREEATGQSIDMSNSHQNLTRNDVLWESALPLAKLYSPLVVVNDTFILQEYFVPHDSYCAWIDAVRPIFKEINEYQNRGSFDAQEEGKRSIAAQSLTLLNTTIRYVDHDTLTFLNYSRKEGGVFSFVLYFRIKPQAEPDLGMFHNRLARAAVDLGGTFYLPYRKCYEQDLLVRSYPQIYEFAAKKQQYDPLCLFSSEWFEHYILPLCNNAYQDAFHAEQSEISSATTHNTSLSIPADAPSEEDFLKWLPRADDPSLELRANSYRTLLNDKLLRKSFLEEFLVNVLNIADPSEVMRIMSKAAWDPRNTEDLEIFGVLRQHFHGTPSKPTTLLRQGWRAIRQISHQKAELGHETAMILHRLGKMGRIRGYLSVGDHGKMVHTFQKIGIMDTTCETEIIVAHDFDPEEDELSLPVIIERGSMNPVGDRRIHFDYMKNDTAKAFKNVLTASMDLITLNQGLHHFPQSKLYGFLREMKRILIPGGVFILREHDVELQTDGTVSATSTPVAMLDLAHSVFNAVTGASKAEEISEIRAFRPLSEWRRILERFGFVDSLLYGLEQGDCTFDFMLCFTNGPVSLMRSYQPPLEYPLADVSGMVPQDDEEPAMMKAIRALLVQVPASVAGAAKTIVEKLLDVLPVFAMNMSKFLLVDVPRAVTEDEQKRQLAGSNNVPLFSASKITEFANLVEDFLRSKLDRIVEIGYGAKELLRDIHIRETSNIAGLLTMPELFLVLPLLKRKASLCPESVGELEKMFLDVVESAFPLLLQISTVSGDEKEALGSSVSEEKDEAPANKKVGPDGPVDKNEVAAVITTLGQHIPGLFDPSIVLAESGFSLSQQSALVGSLAATDLFSFAEKIAWYHSQQSWQELRLDLVGDPFGVLNVESVADFGDLPTKERLLSKELDHPWHRALKSFLKGPRVKLKPQVLFGLRMLDLGDLVSLYKIAKEEKSSAEQVRTNSSQTRTGLGLAESTTLNHLMKNLARTEHVNEIRIQFDGTEDSYDLFDVATVVKAEFGYKSLTSSLTDITSELQALHAEVHVSKDSTAPSGWLPIREDMLTSFRNKGGVAKVGDSLRKVVVGTGSLGLAGNNVMRLTYVPVSSIISQQEVQAADQLCAYTERQQLSTGNLHANDGHYTWFKLSEWMQVEMMDIFTKSLEHTPWYQFPFMEFMSRYFQILFRECEIVRSHHGLMEAYASMAFATDLVPGIFMSFLFAQMQLLSVPLKLSLPTYDPTFMTEEILMTAFLPNEIRDASGYFQRVIDKRIRNASLLTSCNITSSGTVSMGLYRIAVPTFKAMGEILIQIGERLPSARILQISNQKVVQVLLCVSSNNAISLESFVTRINGIDGLQVMFHYCYPNDKSRVQVSVKVQVTSLLLLTRFVARLVDVQVKQIFDFWSG